MPCRRKKPTYKTEKAAKRHGSITYGKGKFTVRKVKVKGKVRTRHGWRAYKRKR